MAARSGWKKSTKVAKKATAKRVAAKPRKSESAKPTLLAGGNPQIAKAEGDAPVQAGLTSYRNGKLPTLAASMPS